jgi:hypothetical protein
MVQLTGQARKTIQMNAYVRLAIIAQYNKLILNMWLWLMQTLYAKTHQCQWILMPMQMLYIADPAQDKFSLLCSIQVVSTQIFI